MNTQHHHQAEMKAPRTGAARLSDAALLLLGQAGTRPDGMVLPPPTALRARGSVLAKVLGTLVKAGLVSELRVDTAAQSWRTDRANQPIGLKITAAGLCALGMETPLAAENVEPDSGPTTVPKPPKEAPRTPALVSEGAGSALNPGPNVGRITKQGKLVTLLSGDHGQSVAALAETLSWQQHTVRAALTGLRQKGHVLSKTKNTAGTTVYRIMAPDTAAPNSANLAG